MQLKNKGKRNYVFADFEIKAGEIFEVDESLKEEAERLVEVYKKDLEIVTIKKVAKKADAKEEAKADAK